MKNISAVVINFNGEEYLKKCLAELVKHNELLEIILVDDCSTDGSVEMVKKEFPQVKVLVNDKNRGPIFSSQKGLKEAKGKFIFYIDNDALINESTILNLYNFLEKNNNYWGAGSRVINKSNNKNINFGHYPSLLDKNIIPFFFNLRDLNKTQDVDWFVETAYMVRKDLVDKLGGFDLNFFMYHGIADLSFRAKKEGYKTAFVHNSTVIHFDNYKSTGIENKTNFLMGSTKYYYKKNKDFVSYSLISVSIFIAKVIRKLGYKGKMHYE